MTEIPECPLCGKKIVIEHTIYGITIGCKDCGMMIPTFTFFGLLTPGNEEGRELQRKFEEHLITIWEDTLKKSASLTQSIRTENVLRTAYGMPPVSYMDYVGRECERLQEKRKMLKERRMKERRMEDDDEI